MRNTDVVTTLVSGWALLAVAVIAVVTRYGNAFLTSPTAPDWITGPVALVLSGLGALASYLVDVKGVGTWQGALTVFVGALTATKAIQAVDPGIEPELKGTGPGLSVKPLPGGGLDQGPPAGTPTTGTGTASPFAGVPDETLTNIKAHPEEFIKWSDAPEADRQTMMNLPAPDLTLPEDK